MDLNEQSFNSFQDDQYIESDNRKYPDMQDQINNNIDEDIENESQEFSNANENYKTKNQKQYAFPLTNNNKFPLRNTNSHKDFEINHILNNIKEPLKSYILNLKNQNNIKNKKLIEFQKQNDENEILISNLQMDNHLMKSKLENLQKNYENEIDFLQKQKNNKINIYEKMIENDENLDFQKFNFHEINNEKIQFLMNENHQLLHNIYNLEKENRNLFNQNKELQINILNKNDLIQKLNNKINELTHILNNNFEFGKIINEREKLIEENNELTSGIQDFNEIVNETSEIFKRKTIYFNNIINSYKNKLNEYKNKITFLKSKINELAFQLNLNNELKHNYTDTYNSIQNNTISLDTNDIFEDHNKTANLKENLLFSPTLNDKLYNSQKKSVERYKDFLFNFDNK